MVHYVQCRSETRSTTYLGVQMTLIVGLVGKDSMVVVSDDKQTCHDGWAVGVDYVKTAKKQHVIASKHVVGLIGRADIAEQVAFGAFNRAHTEWSDVVNDLKNLITPYSGVHPLGMLLAGYSGERGCLSYFDSKSPYFPHDRTDWGVYGTYPMAEHLLFRLYKPNLTVDQMKRLGLYVIHESRIFGEVGSPSHISVITPKKAELMTENEVADLYHSEQKHFGLISKALADKYWEHNL